jgi:hypothetical protein
MKQFKLVMWVFPLSSFTCWLTYWEDETQLMAEYLLAWLNHNWKPKSFLVQDLSVAGPYTQSWSSHSRSWQTCFASTILVGLVFFFFGKGGGTIYLFLWCLSITRCPKTCMFKVKRYSMFTEVLELWDYWLLSFEFL